MNLRQEKFVQEYLVDGNGTAAAIRAGYAPKTAAWTACKLLKDKKIKAAIALGQRQLAAKIQITAERVIEELAAIGFADLGQLYKDGNLLPISELPEQIRRALAAVKVGQEGVVEYRLWDKVAALEKLGKHLGLFGQKVDVKVTGEVEFGDREQIVADLTAVLAQQIADGGEGGSDGEGQPVGAEQDFAVEIDGDTGPVAKDGADPAGNPRPGRAA